MPEGIKFRYRLDIYWKSLAIFSITLLVWSFISGAMESDGFDVSLTDPISILLIGILGLTLLSMLIAMYKANRIIFFPDHIIFKNRIRRKKIEKSDIISVEAGREKTFGEDDLYSVIRVNLKNRKRPLRIRPSMFYEEQQLTAMLLEYMKEE
jgi:hypothetical protein